MAVLGVVCGCGGSPQSLVDGAGESRGATATTPPPPAAAKNTSVCVQGALQTCTVQLGTQGTVHQCFSGMQLCSGGAWTDCQDLSVLVGVRSEAFAASCASGESSSWKTLDYVVDAPTNASGRSDVTITVAGHPELVLFTTQTQDVGAAEVRSGSLGLDVLGALENQADLTLQITTTTTPDSAMAATARAAAKYACSPAGHGP
jgi:hypothetical protein